jgi:hypothetical protein
MGIKRFFKSVYKKVIKPAGKVLGKVGGKALKTVEKIGSKVGKYADRSLDNINALQKNVTGLLSPGNIVLYVGGFIAVVYLLPRILDSSAATEAAKRIR